DLRRAVPIGVGLDDGDRSRRPIRPLALDVLDDMAVIRCEGVQIDAGGSGANHRRIICCAAGGAARGKQPRCAQRTQNFFDQGSPRTLRWLSAHAPTARFSKRVYSRMNASLTIPVGPLRCLAMISSATPCVSAGGWLLSAYMSSR